MSRKGGSTVMLFSYLLGLAILPLVAAYRIPQPAVLPRQGVSNSSLVSSTTTSPTQTADAGSSSVAATITSAPLSQSSAGVNGTCPTLFSSDFPDHPFATYTETCQSARSRAAFNKFDALTDTCLASYCEQQWTSTWESLMSGTTVWATSTRTFFSGIEGTGSLSTVVTGQDYFTSTFTYVVPPAKRVTLDRPCCGQCTFDNPTIQLYFWPTMTTDPTPSVTGLPANATAMVTGLPVTGGTYIDDNGFTFISPSLYIGFTSLGAHDYCGPVGSEIYNTTIAFDPTEVSTMFPQVTRATCTVTWTDYYSSVSTTTDVDVTTPAPAQLTIADVAQDCSTIDGYYWFANNPSLAAGDAAGDPCHPVIALPTKVQELQPAWSECLPIYGGFYDPPKTLKQGTALVPTTASQTPEPTTELKPSQADPTSQSASLSQAQSTPPQDPPPNASQTSEPNDPQDPPPNASQTSVPNDPQDPVSNESQEPSVQPQPSDPAQGSSTTIVITPPPSKPSNAPPSVTVITLEPGPSIGGTVPIPSNVVPQDQSSPDAQPDQPVITLQPTIIPPAHVELPGSTAVIIGTVTLMPGGTITVGGTTSTLPNGQTTVVDGTQLVLDPQATAIVVGGTSTIALPPALTDTASTSDTEIVGNDSSGAIEITVGSTTLTADEATRFTIGGQTLTGGGTVTADGTTYVLTTDKEGSTVLVAGTAGASVSESSPSSVEAFTTGNSNDWGSANSTARGSSGSLGTVIPMPSNSSATGTSCAKWGISALIVGFWAIMMA